MDTDEQAPNPARWLPLIALSALPLVAGVVLLEAMTPSGDPLSTQELAAFKASLSRHDYLPGGLTYAALTLVHVATCLVALYMAWAMLRRTSAPAGPAAAGMAMAALLLVLLPFLASEAINAYDLSYFAIADLFSATGAGKSFLLPVLGRIRALDLAIYLPTAVGIVAVAMMAAAATGQLRLLDEWPGDPAADEETRLCVVLTRMKRCLYMLAAVLVTSTLTASFFFHMPAKMQLASPEASAKHAALLKRLEGFAAELSIFWGAVFTLTLAASVALPMLLAQQRLRDFVDGLRPPELASEVRGRLAQAGLAGQAKDHLKLFLALAAPLASGPVGALLQAAKG